MNGVAVYGWCRYQWGDSGDGMDGGSDGGFLPCMDTWMMDVYEWNATCLGRRGHHEEHFELNQVSSSFLIVKPETWTTLPLRAYFYVRYRINEHSPDICITEPSRDFKCSRCLCRKEIHPLAAHKSKKTR